MMRPCLVGLAVIATLGFVQFSAASETFSEFLKRIEHRDPQTKAISAIRNTDKNRVFVWTSVEVKKDMATFTYTFRSKLGDENVVFEFPIEKEVMLEVARLRNYEEMLALRAKAEAAAIAYQTFVVSQCRLRVGDTLEKADAQMGVPRKTHPNQGAWAERTHYVYEDGLHIDCVRGAVERAWREEGK